MFRSPPSLRSGKKAKPVLLSADQSAQLSPQPLLAAGTPTSQSDNMVDPAIVERCVSEYLSGETVLDRLIKRLADHMKVVIEDAVRAAIVGVNSEVAALRSELSGLRESVNERTDELEQYQRRNNLRIFGIKETVKEDTDALVVGLCREKLGVQLSEDVICRSHRVGRKMGPTEDGREVHRPIIVRFISYRDRRLIYGNKKKLKGTGVTIREDLTTQRVKVWREAVQRHGLKNTWTQDGKVLWVDKDGRRGAASSLRDLGIKSTNDTNSSSSC